MRRPPLQPVPPLLPDTPPWPARRFGTTAALFLAGAATLAAGIALPLGEAMGLRLVETGADMMVLAVGLYLTGASAERVGGWLALRRGAPHAGHPPAPDHP
ncbi:hypothetical protein [Niveispirillum fermenti]|uniref:hypothetical protein n=1 Tax=Niveispirillum fermenti TaxID=1233113 RepID=UPI003A86ED5A